MTVGRFRFNFILMLMPMLLIGVAGCKTTKEDDPPGTTLRFHLTTNPDASKRHTTATIGRTSPFVLYVQEQPFLSEVYIVEANLIDVLGGFAIQVKFDRQGRNLLEQFTTAYRGRRIGIYSAFGEARWLAAPMIRKTISDGAFVFTPDATREEAERMVLGLKNVASEVRKNADF